MRILLFCLLYLGFSACSKIETGISLAPRLITNKIDDAFDFTSKKKSNIKAQVEIDLDLAKSNLIQKVIRHLDQINEIYLKKTPTESLLIEFYNDLTETQTLIITSFKNTADLTFKDIQLSEIANYKSYSEKKMNEDYVLSSNQKKFITLRSESMIKFYEFFLDSLDDQQKQNCTDFIEKNVSYLINRIKIRQKFSEALQIKLIQKENVLDFYLTNYSGIKFTDIKDAEQKNYLLDLFSFQTKLAKTFTPKQKEHLLKKLEELKSELVQLSHR